MDASSYSAIQPSAIYRPDPNVTINWERSATVEPQHFLLTVTGSSDHLRSLEMAIGQHDARNSIGIATTRLIEGSNGKPRLELHFRAPEMPTERYDDLTYTQREPVAHIVRKAIREVETACKASNLTCNALFPSAGPAKN